jgi:hypothetical protein
MAESGVLGKKAELRTYRIADNELGCLKESRLYPSARAAKRAAEDRKAAEPANELKDRANGRGRGNGVSSQKSRYSRSAIASLAAALFGTSFVRRRRFRAMPEL